MKRIVHFIQNIDEYVSVGIMLAILVVVILQILSRVIPGNAIAWTLELAEILLGALIWMTISVGVTKNTHVCFDLVVKRLPARISRILVILDNFIFIAYLIVLGIFTIQILDYYLIVHQTSTMLEISKFWIRMPILIGCIMTIIRLSIKQYRLMTKKEKISFSDSSTAKGVQ
jgi:TRAP-type C4-dicarboxylate transport system permease small subunit